MIGLSDALPAVHYTFGELDALADTVARALHARYARGERIAILAANSAHHIAIVLGIMRAGLVAVPVNFKFPRALIADVIADSGARLVFCDAKRLADVPAALPVVVFDDVVINTVSDASSDASLADGTNSTSSTSSASSASSTSSTSSTSSADGASALVTFQAFTVQAGASSTEQPCAPFNPVTPSPGEAALILYTSGSTGRPKGVVLSHESHLWIVKTRLQSWPRDDERVLIAAPLFHMNALALAFLALAARATMVLLPQFNARQYIRAIDEWQCTWITAVPPMIAMMLQERALLDQSNLSSVRYVRMGSAPVSGALLEQIHRLLPNAKVINAYGTTEGGPVVFGPHPAGLPTPVLSVGAAHPEVELRLLDEHGAQAQADEGELALRSRGLMTGYHNRPELRAPITPDGFYKTGDVFHRDANGFYTFVGRRDDMFVSGGENIFPGDVEKMLERHPAIQQACVVPVDDEIKGTKPVAFVVLKPGVTADVTVSADDIKAFALAHAPAYQHPRQVWFVAAIPLASTNKIDRTALKRQAAGKIAANPGRTASSSPPTALQPTASTPTSTPVTLHKT
jgi:acyl-CoA synthetase (AMP-forming)/AMP-acid ligase II